MIVCLKESQGLCGVLSIPSGETSKGNEQRGTIVTKQGCTVNQRWYFHLCLTGRDMSSQAGGSWYRVVVVVVVLLGYSLLSRVLLLSLYPFAQPPVRDRQT